METCKNKLTKKTFSCLNHYSSSEIMSQFATIGSKIWGARYQVQKVESGLFSFIQKEKRHSMATANPKKSEDFVTNTTALSKYILRRTKISTN